MRACRDLGRRARVATDGQAERFDHAFDAPARTMSIELDPFDLDAAGVRRALTDLRAFMEALAARLQGALPDRVTVERRRDGLLSSTRHVHEIVLRAEGGEYRLRFDKGTLTATRAKAVRGVVISTTEQPVPQWLNEVRAEVAALAGAMGSASDVLHDFL